jgi:hypothetical protein
VTILLQFSFSKPLFVILPLLGRRENEGINPSAHFLSHFRQDFLTQEKIDFLAGSAAGALSIVVGQPFDTIKVSHTLLSFQELDFSSSHASSPSCSGEITNKYEILRSY